MDQDKLYETEQLGTQELLDSLVMAMGSKELHETIEQCLDLAWELYDEDEINNAFEIKTVTTVTPR